MFKKRSLADTCHHCHVGSSLRSVCDNSPHRSSRASTTPDQHEQDKKWNSIQHPILTHRHRQRSRSIPSSDCDSGTQHVESARSLASFNHATLRNETWVVFEPIPFAVGFSGRVMFFIRLAVLSLCHSHRYSFPNAHATARDPVGVHGVEVSDVLHHLDS